MTANHWGDKSKEIYAKAAMTRQFAYAAGIEVFLLGVLDGDVDEGALQELASGIGYDVVLSARELLIATGESRGFTPALKQASED